MKIALVACGTRGDVQPLVALTLGLKRAGHEALLLAPPENEAWVTSLGCPYRAVGSAIRGNALLKGGGLGAMRKFVRQEIGTHARELPDLLKGHDLVVATGLVFAVPSVAESLGLPYRFVAFSPASSLGTTRDSVMVKALGWLAAQAMNAGLRSTLNRMRSSLGLGAIDDVLSHWVGQGTIAATDAALTVLPPGVSLRTTQTGYMHLDQQGELDADVRAFLASGPAPVYVSFGSLPIAKPERMSRLLADASRRAGRRLIVSSGWAGLKSPDSMDDCLFVGDVPHQVLFPHLAAVVHSGGAGTVATAARAGVPQIVLPHMSDQFQWRAQIVKLGLGPSTPILRMVSVGSLARAIVACVEDERYARRAKDVAAAIQTTNGVDLTIRALPL